MPRPTSDLEVLLDPGHTMQTTLAGSPGCMRTHARWDTGVRILDQHLIYLLIRGSALLESQREQWILPSQAVIVVPPGIPFRIRSHLAAPTILRLRLALRNRAGSRWQCANEVLVRQDGRRARPWLEALIAETPAAAVPDAGAASARVRALSLLLISEIMSERPTARSEGQFDERQRCSLETLLEAQRAAPLTPRDLAAHLGLSMDYCTRCFRRSFGVSPREHLVRQRIRRSCALLAQDARSLPLGAVAQCLGYRDVNLYQRQFRRVMGVAPGVYRASQAAQVPL